RVPGLDDQHVGMDATRDACAGRAAAACVDWQLSGDAGLAAGWRLLFSAIERLGDGDGRQALADAGWPGKQQARRQCLPCHRPREQWDEADMAHDVPKWHKEFGTIVSL